MIITKADIGRKAVARNGEVWTYKGESDEPDYPHRFFDSNGLTDEFCDNGQFWGCTISEYDLISWVDETEGAQ